MLEKKAPPAAVAAEAVTHRYILVALTDMYNPNERKWRKKNEPSRISCPYRICSIVNKFYNISIRFNLEKSKNYKFWKRMDIVSYKWFSIRSAKTPCRFSALMLTLFRLDVFILLLLILAHLSWFRSGCCWWVCGVCVCVSGTRCLCFSGIGYHIR